MQRRWVVLAEGSSNDAIDDAALEAGFGLVNVIPRGDAYPRQRIYARAGGATFLHDVLDHALGARILVLAGVDLEVAEGAIRSQLDVIEPSSLAALCSADDLAVATRAIKLLGIAASGRAGDAERAAFERAASSPDPDLRAAAKAAAAFAGVTLSSEAPR